MPGKSPGPSIKNPRVYEALRRKGYSKERSARISNAQVMGKLYSRLWHDGVAKAKRKYHDVRDDTGRFSETSGGGGKKPADKPKKPTAEERAAASREQAATNRANVAKEVGMEPSVMEALDEFASPDEKITLSPANREALTAAGLVEQGADGEDRLTAAGKTFLRAAEKGDVRTAADTLSASKERAARAAAEAEKEPKGGGGGGSKSKEEQEAENVKTVIAAMSEQDEGLDAKTATALMAFGSGSAVDDADSNALVSSGLIARGADGTHRLTSEGKAAIKGMKAGDVRTALDAISTAADKMQRTKKYAPFDITKSDGESRIVYGIASTAMPDNQGGRWNGERYDGDIVDPAAIQDAIAEYMQWSNVREMHGDSAAGTTLDMLPVDDTVYIVAKIGDDSAWRKIQDGIYKGFSIGGKVLDAIIERLPDGRHIRRIIKMLLTEVSLVDRPANPEAAILIAKRDTMSKKDELNLADIIDDDKRDDDKRDDETSMKKAADPTKVVQQIQQLRDAAELEGDLQTAARYSEAIMMLLGDGEDEAAEGEMPAEDAAPEVGAMEGEPMAMAAGASLKKIGRKIAASRMTLIKRAWLDYGKVLAEAGDEEAQKFFKMIEDTAGQEKVQDATKAIEAQLKKMLSPIASTLLSVNDMVERISSQPVAGGPLVRSAGQPITKRLDPVPQAQTAEPENDVISELRRLALTEVNPVRKQQYEQKLAELTKR